MKIVHVITGTGLGGAEVMLDTVLRALGPGYASQVVSLQPLGPVGERMRARGVAIDTVGMRAGVPDPRAVLRLTRLLRGIGPDLVHTWMYHADLVGGIAARLAGVRRVAWAIHNSTLDPGVVKASTRAVVRACAALSGRVPDAILCCSDVARRIHVGYGYPDPRIEVIPNGLDIGRFAPDPHARHRLRAELGIAPEAPLVGLVARWDPQKNHAGFLRAAAAVRAARPETRFVLAGTRIEDGNPELAALVGAHGLRDAVRLLGPRDDVPQLMAGLDLLVSASVYGEAFPIVLGEAMACGVPCVATDVGDSALIVADTGRIVPPSDDAALAGAIVALLGATPEARRALGERARERIAGNFDIERVARRYEAFYDRLNAR
jgi:glycosyltransferase involved in cell wall biosynthesis